MSQGLSVLVLVFTIDSMMFFETSYLGARHESITCWSWLPYGASTYDIGYVGKVDKNRTCLYE